MSLTLFRRRLPVAPSVLVAAIAFACFAWASAFGPDWGERAGDRTAASAWQAGAPVQHLRPPTQTIVARQTGFWASVQNRSAATPPLVAEACVDGPAWSRSVRVVSAGVARAGRGASAAWPRAPPVSA
jgi:hypothetical protein